MVMLPSLNQFELLARSHKHFEKVSDPYAPHEVNQPFDPNDLKGIAFYAPFGKTYQDVQGQIKRMDNNEKISIEHKTLAECVADYFSHGEAKAANPKGIGRLERQHLQIIEHIFIGKETNRIKDEISEESEGIIEYEEAAEYGRRGWAELLKQKPIKVWSKLTYIPTRTLYDIIDGAKPNVTTKLKILKALCKIND